jgi:AraC-like DNA-binding protein
MAVVWRSDGVAERDQFASWREAVCQHIYAMTPEREKNCAGFRGAITATRLGGLDFIELQCDGHIVARRSEDIVRAASDTYYVYCQRANSAWFRQAEREVVAQPGDVVIADPNIPFVTGTSSSFNFRIWRMPRRMLDPLRASRSSMMMTHLRYDNPLGAVLSDYLASVAGQAGRMDPVAEETVSEYAARLAALALGISSQACDRGRDALREVKFTRVLRYIDRHLAEPDLTPRVVAARTGMSVRALHLLFELKGVSFGQWVQRRRLEEIKALLSHPGAADRSVADIAFSWGFNDLSTFYRAFHSAYGERPGRIRPRR